MKTVPKKQKGFLAIVAVLLVVILAFIAVTATYQFTGDALSSANHLKSTQAFYVAEGGLANAKTSILGGTSCNGYASGTLSLGPGQYSVTGTTNNAATLLGSILTANATTIPLITTAGFSSSGGAMIDSEIISYNGISGNSLINVVRGVSGTTAALHIIGTPVLQNECFLTAAGGVPTIANPTGSRTLKTLLVGSNFSININGTSAIPAAISTSSVSLQGTPQVVNPSISASNPGYPGSNIISSGPVSLGGASTTENSNGVGGLVTSSSSGHISPDIIQGTSAINSGNLFSKFFNKSKAQVQSGATASNGSNLDGVTGQTIWVTGDLNLASQTTIGSLIAPVVLYVSGNLSMRGGSTIYGFVYVAGSVDNKGNSNIFGLLSAEGPIDLGGTATLTLDSNVLTLVSNINGSLNTTYNTNPVILQEYFP